MTVSMTELMRNLRNCFVSGAACGTWKVEGGVLTGDPELRPGWIAIEGMGAFLLGEGGVIEGVPEASLPSDGPVEGPVWLLDPPADVVRLLGEINDWLAARNNDAMTAGAGGTGTTITRRRESFGVYTTETAYSTGTGSSGSWEAAFAGRLTPYRRMFPEVKL